MTYPTNVEVKNLGYSLKNIIPIPTKQHYLKYMIDKVESFIARLRWKAYFFEKPDQCNSSNSTNFGYELNITPPQNEKLTPFENGLYDMVWSIKFKSVRNNFQSMLKEDLSKMPPAQYKRLLNKTISKTYCKVDSNAKWNNNKEEVVIRDQHSLP